MPCCCVSVEVYRHLLIVTTDWRTTLSSFASFVSFYFPTKICTQFCCLETITAIELKLQNSMQNDHNSWSITFSAICLTFRGFRSCQHFSQRPPIRYSSRLFIAHDVIKSRLMPCAQWYTFLRSGNPRIFNADSGVSVHEKLWNMVCHLISAFMAMF